MIAALDVRYDGDALTRQGAAVSNYYRSRSEWGNSNDTPIVPGKPKNRGWHGSSFPFRPHPCLTVFADLNMNYVGMATDRAVLDIFLARPSCHVERNDDLLAARVADIVGLVVHNDRASMASQAQRAFTPASSLPAVLLQQLQGCQPSQSMPWRQ